ncbi:hypothetical protein FOA52_008778 [Chlamydomonas sp. UWO 241]|nr:hypothetical protein FOA52_008778 [Chlamydomonas sp. UWO 241]
MAIRRRASQSAATGTVPLWHRARTYADTGVCELCPAAFYCMGDATPQECPYGQTSERAANGCTFPTATNIAPFGTAFASSSPAEFCNPPKNSISMKRDCFTNINDRFNGNYYSWTHDASDTDRFVGIRFSAPADLNSFAVSRDATIVWKADHIGNVYLQVTTAADPGVDTTAWTTVSTGTVMTALKRQRFSFDEEAGVTGVRLIVAIGVVIDELELGMDLPITATPNPGTLPP